jgi:hypothetical protein
MVTDPGIYSGALHWNSLITDNPARKNATKGFSVLRTFFRRFPANIATLHRKMHANNIRKTGSRALEKVHPSDRLPR